MEAYAPAQMQGDDVSRLMSVCGGEKLLSLLVNKWIIH